MNIEENDEINQKLKQKQNSEYHNKSSEQVVRLNRLLEISTLQLPKYGVNWTNHALCTLAISSMTRIFYYNELYKKIIDIPGVICEFGVQWGAGMAQLINLRSMYEPHNISRKIFGFDTFTGFSSLDPKDGGFSNTGDYKTISNYKEALEEILILHEASAARSNIKKFFLIEGDASITIDDWLLKNPYAIVSMALFDMDVYKPTKDVLQKILPRLTRGSVLVFDELNCDIFPGETLAVQEVLGLNNIKLRKTPFQPFSSYAVFGE